MKRLLWGFLLILILMSSASALKEGNIKILAVSQESIAQGSVADLSLEIVPGKGRVFLETFPVTKVDTQISMRFAQQFACRFVEQDCSSKDFIYTIRAGSAIVGGPSAGASATVLTIALLDNIKLSDEVVITGTISPGGLIGSVGGIKEKVEAAQHQNFSTVLIPLGKRTQEEGNTTIDLVEYGDTLGITVKEVATIEDTLSEYNKDKQYFRPTGEIQVEKKYEQTMREVANRLCERNNRLRNELKELKQRGNLTRAQADLLVDTENNILNAKKNFNNKKYYSAASFCFRSNYNVALINTQLRNQSQEELAKKIVLLKKGINELNKNISRKDIKSISDLQTFLIVKERLIEATDHTNSALQRNMSLAPAVALANERLYSAVVWSSFFQSDSQKLTIDKKSLKNSCEQKLQEAEERYQYVTLYLPAEPTNIRKDLDRAYNDAKNGDTDQCLFKASRAKADADMVISIIGIKEDQVRQVVDQKIELANQAILQSQEKGVFPIIGYSYYEYAKSLVDNDIISALRFTQYAIELSTLDLYFDPISGTKIRWNKEAITVLIAGLIIGFLIRELFVKKE